MSKSHDYVVYAQDIMNLRVEFLGPQPPVERDQK